MDEVIKLSATLRISKHTLRYSCTGTDTGSRCCLRLSVVKTPSMTMAGHIQFIDLTQKSTQASEHNRQLIRSHIAKNNRRKRILPTGQRQKHNATRARLIAPLGLSLDDGEPEATSSIAGTSSVGEQDVEEAGNTVSERSTMYACWRTLAMRAID